jgi:hypothetical protein
MSWSWDMVEFMFSVILCLSCVHVGKTGLKPEERFANHKAYNQATIAPLTRIVGKHANGTSNCILILM